MERQNEVLEGINELAWEAVTAGIYRKQEPELNSLEERLWSQVSDDAWKSYAAIDEIGNDQATEVNDYIIRIVFSIPTSMEPKSPIACDGLAKGQERGAGSNSKPHTARV